MKKLIQRLAVMNIALVLFATTAVAVNGNDSESEQNPYGVTIEKKIKLKSGNKKSLPINVLKGYKNPILMHIKDNGILGIYTILKTRLFTAKVINEGEKYSLEIMAEKGIRKTETDTVYINALKETPQRRNPKARAEKRTDKKEDPNYGVPLIITVRP